MSSPTHPQLIDDTLYLLNCRPVALPPIVDSIRTNVVQQAGLKTTMNTELAIFAIVVCILRDSQVVIGQKVENNLSPAC